MENVDTPWSFVIGVSSLIAQMLIGGYAFSNGLFYEIFNQTFRDSSPVLVGLMSNLPICTWFGGCLLGSLAINKYGVRRACTLGSLLASLSLVACYFSIHIFTVLVCYGTISGLGHGIAYNGFITAINRSFRRYRTMMTGLCTLGIYLGMTCYSFLIPYISTRYSLQDIFLLLAGISLNMLVCASTIFSLQSTPRTQKAFNFRVLTKNTHFLLFSLQCFCCNLSNLLYLVHLPALLLSRDFSTAEAALSLTVFGVSNCVGKATFGFGSHLIHLDVVLVYLLSMVGVGICSILLPLGGHLYWIFAFDAMLGFLFNTAGGHTFLSIGELVGEDDFADGVGITFFCKSVGVLISGPISGFLFETSGIYDVTIYTSGAIMIFGCTLLVPVCIYRLRNEKNNHRSNSFIITEEGIGVSSRMIKSTELPDNEKGPKLDV